MTSSIDTQFIDSDLLDVFEELDQTMDPNLHQIPSAELYKDIARVSTELGRVPRRQDYAEHGEYSVYAVVSRFHIGSWGHSLRDLGFIDELSELGPEYGEQSQSVTEDALRADIERIIETLGHAPGRDEYTEYGEYSVRTVLRILGPSNYNWSDMLDECGYK